MNTRRNWQARPAEPTRRWQVGAVRITKVSESVLESALDEPSDEEGFLGQASRKALLGIDWLRPDFITDEGAVLLAFHMLVVEAPGRTIVVDTCVGNGKLRPQHPFWDGQELPFLTSLADAGVRVQDVDTVVCTHLHVDHVGWNTMLRNGRWVPTFPNARYLFGRREYEACTREMENIGGTSHGLHPSVFIADSVKPVFDTGLADLVEADHRICAEVRLIPTHGHTPGHVSVLVESEGARALITGDSIHHPCQLRHTGWTLAADADRDAAAATRAALLDRHADTPTLFIGTHWAGRSCGYVERDGRSYRLNSTAAAS
ncbi:MAG: MBL fold metallo-hydrolase [Burkholderiaceae bacterium]